MKKYLFGLAITAALAGCSNNEVTETVDSTQRISFSTLNDKVNSRDANDAASDYQVLAEITNTTPSAWFINEKIIGSTDAIASGNVYYWGGNTISFYAYAPIDGVGGVEANTTYGATSINFTVPTDADTDFTIATPATGKTSGAVNLTFNHMLAKLKISAALSSALTGDGYSIKEAPKATVVVPTSSATIDPTATPLAWSSPNSTSATYSGENEYNIIPQASTGITIQLAGLVIQKSGVPDISVATLKVYTIASGDVADDNFFKGTQYNITITIDSNANNSSGAPIFGGAISFESSVSGWGTPVEPDITQP